MSNIVALRRLPVSLEPVVPALVDLFANRRRGRHDAFWLKENAELLQIIAALGAGSRADLAPLASRADDLMQELRFFPQYYRMYLSIAVDLRALGLAEAPVEEMAAFVRANDLLAVELSDTHRGEANLLLRRAGMTDAVDPALEARLMRFACTPALFCLPNRRAAYDLTHIVFHASDYGRQALEAPPELRLSLIHAGMNAWLEGNLDLLAEVTLALRFSGHAVPPAWAAAVAGGADAVSFTPDSPTGSFDDDYHQYLVLNWAQAVAGRPAFSGGVPPQARIIRQPARQDAALRDLSLALLDMGAARMPDWARMRWRVLGKLPEASRQRLNVVETMPEFEGFFAGFSRAGQIGSVL